MNAMTNKSTPTVSAVVVTYRRPEGLSRCLAALAQQTAPPVEVVVVDNGADFGEEARQVCQTLTGGISIQYVFNPVNSLSAARNLGVRNCSGDFVALVDDDVRLPPDYLERVLRVFSDRPEAVAVQGYIVTDSRPRWREFLQRLFGLYHHEPDRCRVLPAISTTYPAPLTHTISCEWVSGSNQVYRRSVLNEILWDERLLKYADGEDLDHSFRVYQRYPGRLFITPDALVLHDASATGRVVGCELIAMREVYGWYLLHKLFPCSLRAKAAYLWSRMGRLVLTVGAAFSCCRPGAWTDVWSLLCAYWLVWQNRHEISIGKFDRFNSVFGLKKG